MGVVIGVDKIGVKWYTGHNKRKGEFQMKFYIYIGNREITEVAGYDFAWETYCKARELADFIGQIAHLVDGETGEIIESSDDWDDYDPDYEPDGCGFDPYEGCYTYDC